MTEFPLNPTPAIQSDAPAVVRYMQENKLLLEARDADQMQLMVQRWLYMEDQLGARISDLTQYMAELKAAGEPITQEMLMARQRYQRLLWQVQQELEDYTEFAADLIAKSQKELGKMGIEHAAQAIQLSLGEGTPGVVGAYFDRLPISAIENMVGVTATGSPVAEVLAKHWPNAVQKMTDILVRNTGLGVNPRQTAREMADGMAAEGLNNAMTVARTEQLRVYREASREQYKKSGLVQQYERMCAHQPRTCMACIALDGEIYETSELMALHPNDRCIMIPIVDGMPRIERETGKEWFEKQPEHVQREMMGPGRHDLYKDGSIDIDDMVVIGDHPDWGPTASVKPLRDLQATEIGGVPVRFSSMDPGEGLTGPGTPNPGMYAGTEAGKRTTNFTDAIGHEVDDWTDLDAIESHEMFDEFFGVDPSKQPNIATDTRFAGTISGNDRDYITMEIDNASDFLKGISDGDALGFGVDAEYMIDVNVKHTAQRANWTGRSINTSVHSEASTYVHEMGHFLEDMAQGGELTDIAADFLESRSVGERLRAVNRSGDLGWRDKWLNSYTGRDYGDGATEIISMGLEALYENPVEFAMRDPEHFAFVIDVLQHGGGGL